MAHKVGRLEKTANLVMKLVVRAGIGSEKTHLLTVLGRKTGRRHTTPVSVLRLEGERWLVAPYGSVSWAANVRASGHVTLGRGRRREALAAREVDPAVAARVLKAYVEMEPGTRRAFGLEPNAPLADWEAIAPKHPVFRLEQPDVER